MFQDYFGIAEDPFAITPDPKYLFLSERHRNGFAHLLYGVTQGGGFVQLTGEVGTGKTLLCRKLLAQLPRAVDVAFVFNPRLSPLELVATICDELRVLYPLGCSSIKEIVDFLNAYLLESHSQGRRTVVIIDEAQNLSFESLEQIRLLTNLETSSEKLLQIILVGQPELRSLLNRPELRQLAQRVTARYHLTPLSRSETRAYILHRLKVAGLERPLFTEGAIRRVYKLSGGIPRLINILCSRGMLAAYGKRKGQVSRSMLSQVARELRGEDGLASRFPSWGWMMAGVSATLLVLALLPQVDLFQLFAEPNHEGQLVEEQQSQQVQQPQEIQQTQQPQQPKPVQASQPVQDTQQTSEVNKQPAALPVAGAIIEQAVATEPDRSGMAVPDVLSPEALKAADQASTSIAMTAQDEIREQESSARTDAKSSELSGLIGNENSAFSTLFSYWQVVYPTGGKQRSSCDKAEEVGLSCLFGRGSWKTLEYYNRPAILELMMAQGERYHVVLTGMGDQSVTLDMNGRKFSFDYAEMDRLWTGSYIILWRPPSLAKTRLQLGQSGSDVGWLISTLDKIEGVESAYDLTNPRFDQLLHLRVMRFQRENGLSADGIVGKQTLIQLKGMVTDRTRPALLKSGG
ncbi:MAG: AAA family ATPase [Candidatus Thiodiazotropha lotti]|nr:AAA family ATPase [Candidatus Thiodiazotropha lotti]MCG8000444.1 AAA family ATPase [Candidatus Thiodiazotropha lotti]MCW4183485.1 AAA family ATPase [Candidatus Thiodiazotropha weberae]MCW4192214.1 AAA family ATPase [Candidatus Thiodiazotropha weberae]